MNIYSNPEIHKKDQRNIEKTLGSVKELLSKQIEEKIDLYIKKNNIVKYNEFKHSEPNGDVKQSIK